MFLARDTITPLIFRIRSLVLLWGFALTLNSKTPHAKFSKGLQSGELGGQISFTHTSVRFFWSQSCVLLLLWAGAPSCWKMKCLFSAIWSILWQHLFHSCSGNVHLLRLGPHQPAGAPGDELVQVGGQDLSLVVTYLAVIIVSENPLEALNLSYFHLPS